VGKNISLTDDDSNGPKSGTLTGLWYSELAIVFNPLLLCSRELRLQPSLLKQR
jgi:hypothetical protein